MTLNEKLLSTPKLFARENDIIQWGLSRNIIGDTAQGTFEGQQEKTRQEWQEWKDNHSEDDIGDVFVTLVMQCALKGTTVSDILQECFDDFTRFIGINHKTLLEVCEDRFDSDINDLLNMTNNFEINIAYVTTALYMVCEKYGWTLDECIEEAWNDIKDRKGVMCHGTFVKQTNLDALQELGITYNKELQAFTGTIFSDSHLKRADEVFYNLGITYTCTGDYSSGVYVESTGSN